MHENIANAQPLTKILNIFLYIPDAAAARKAAAGWYRNGEEWELGSEERKHCFEMSDALYAHAKTLDANYAPETDLEEGRRLAREAVDFLARFQVTGVRLDEPLPIMALNKWARKDGS